MDSAVENTASVYIEGLFFAAELKDFRMVRQIFSWFPWDEKERLIRHYPHLETWKNTSGVKKESVLAEYARLDTENAYVCIQKTLYAETQGDLRKAEELWCVCANECPPGFQWELIEIAVRNHFSLKPLLNQMTPEEWGEYAQTVAGRKEWDAMKGFFQEIMPLLEGYPFYARKLEQCFLEKLLTRELTEPVKLIKLMEQYCMSVCADAETLYRDEALADPAAYALPTRYRFAVSLKKALEFIRDKKPIDSFPYLKEALRIYPGMSEAVGQLLRYLEEETLIPKQAVPEEFQRLGSQVKQVLRGLMDAGKWEEARSVMEQLLSLLPDDLEVLRMKQEILRAVT